jgi:hypothetical protein
MNMQKSELARFIYSECYDSLFETVSHWVTNNPNSLELLYPPFDPDSATVEYMAIEFTTNVSISEDTIDCDVIVNCDPILIEQNDFRHREKEVAKWFRVNCQIIVEEQLKKFIVFSVAPYEKQNNRKCDNKADNNLVPIIGRMNLDEEAEKFLRRYYPQALTEAMPVPIEKIVKEKMGLTLLMGSKITDNLGIFGQICFSAGKVKLYNPITGSSQEKDVERGTIIIDVATYWERNLGCVNNTIAHEAFHWHKHRVYATVHSLLNKEKFIAHRCPAKSVQAYDSDEKIEWSDEDRMEWQANHIAPRILMPIQTVKPMIEELYKRYDFYNNTDDRSIILECIIDELSTFYKVSKQSAKIRMLDLGYTEANNVYNYDGYTSYFTQISERDAFYEYCDNENFRKIIDSGLFRYVEGQYLIDDEKYIISDNGEFKLTDYAKNNISECALQFTYRRVNLQKHGQFHTDIFHRTNTATYTKLASYGDSVNTTIIDNAEELARKREEFQKSLQKHRRINKTFPELVILLMEDKHWNSVIFKEETMLGDAEYSKIINKKDKEWSLRTVMAICIGLQTDQLTAEQLAKSAGHTLNGSSKECCAYSFMLTQHWTIDECNTFLESEEMKPLGNISRN